MTLEATLRLTDLLVGFAFVQQSLEHCVGPRDERRLFFPRLLLATLLAAGIYPALVSWGLLGLGVLILRRFEGPYNGGCDRMSLLILMSLCVAHIAPTLLLQEMSLGYLALQLVSSYFMSGWVKVVNPAWRTGQALADVFAFSAYPVAEHLRGFAQRPRLMATMAWSVMGFELLFPLALFQPWTLALALSVAALFHAANACLFGLNRFFWIWLCAYPALWWFRERIFGP